MTGTSTTAWHLFVPKLVTVLREGYRVSDLRQDAIAGLTVAIVALPLAMALAIASGTTPDKGLVTAVVAGFLISALGGSRFQIGGPTGAFVVVVYGVIAKHGYDGLVLATFMAGVMLLIAGWARLGTWIKYIPEPVITGFTSGIALIIFSSQIKDLFGLQMAAVPAEFIAKWTAYWEHRDAFEASSVVVAAISLLIIVGLRRFAPRIPGFLVAVVAGSVLVWTLDLAAPTVGTRFGTIPSSLPVPHLPAMSLAALRELLPSAFTIAFLAGVESLLSAVVADGMTGRRHRSNCELVAQGAANCASALFGGLPATGAIARTATNIRSGARSPIAGMLHAIFLLLFMLLLAPLCAFIPLASLAAVLIVVAWNMSEYHRLRHLMRAPLGDRIVLLITLALTVLVDLTVAIEVGVVLAAILFMHRMSAAVTIQSRTTLIEGDVDELANGAHEKALRTDLPKDVEVFALSGPFFFGAASRLREALDRIGKPPRVFILLLRDVPLIDATGVRALEDFLARCRRDETAVVLAEAQRPVLETLQSMGITSQVSVVPSFDAAVKNLERER